MKIYVRILENLSEYTRGEKVSNRETLNRCLYTGKKKESRLKCIEKNYELLHKGAVYPSS